MLGWQFTLAELVGGLVLITVMTILLRLFVPKGLEQQARQHAQAADSGHQHHSVGDRLTLHQRIASLDAWSDVASNSRNDWAMLWKQITIGYGATQTPQPDRRT